MDPRQLRECIDACRPDRADWELPELAALAQHIEHDAGTAVLVRQSHDFDRQVVSALAELSVPEGVAERILGVLAARKMTRQPDEWAAGDGSTVVPATDDASQVVPAADEGSAVVPTERHKAVVSGTHDSGTHSSRRRFLAAGAAVAACALAAIGLNWWLSDRPLAGEQVPPQAALWYRQVSEGAWQPISSAPKGFDLPRSIVAAARRWQQVSKLTGYRGVAYDLSSPELGRAVIFVVQAAVQGLPILPPARPQLATGGQAILAWHADGRLYVVVVELDGDRQRLRNFLNSAAPPLA